MFAIGRRPPRRGRLVLVAMLVSILAAGCSGSRMVVAEGTVPKHGPAQVAGFPTPEALAARLAAVELGIRKPTTPESDVDRLGREEQELYRSLAGRPDWQPTAVAAAPPEDRPAVAANLAADAELTKIGVPTDDLPHWRISAPAPVAVLMADYKAAEAAVGVPWTYLAAIHLVETRMSRIRGNSSAGAQGPMQFLPATWAIYGAGGDINSDRDAILAAARLLKARGAPADMGRALFAYNNSDHYVKAVSAYAGVMAADEGAYTAYHAWQVYYGNRLLPEGWSNP